MQDWLTEADGAVEAFLAEEIGELFPEDGFQGEEGGDLRSIQAPSETPQKVCGSLQDLRPNLGQGQVVEKKPAGTHAPQMLTKGGRTQPPVLNHVHNA